MGYVAERGWAVVVGTGLGEPEWRDPWLRTWFEARLNGKWELIEPLAWTDGGCVCVLKNGTIGVVRLSLIRRRQARREP